MMSDNEITHPETNITPTHELQHLVIDAIDLIAENPELESKYPVLASVLSNHVDRLTDAVTDELLVVKN